MATGERNDFQSGLDFISFDQSPLPTRAGSSRNSPHHLTGTGANGVNGLNGLNNTQKISSRKGKERVDPSFDSADEQLLAAKNGRRDPYANGGSGHGIKGQDSSQKGKGNEKKGKRGRDEMDGDTGPSNLKQERKAAERGAPWVDMVDWANCRDPAEMLNEEITAFYDYVSPTRTEYEVRLFVIELIIKAVKNTWPEADISPFGSWQTQLYLPTGDIDLVVTTHRFTEGTKGRLLAELARAMRMAHITNVVAIISKAKVPIIKFVTDEGKLNVDISLNQTNGISAGKILNQYLDRLLGSRQLILVVKAFLSQRSMNEVYTGGLGSYAVICLVISFLQVHPKLRRSELDPERNLGTLLIEFLELYGRNFNYDEVGISIRRGGFYYSKRSRGWSRMGQSHLLSVEDPQDRDNDISGGSFGIRQVRATLAGAYEMLQAKLFERAEQLAGRTSGRYQKNWDPEDMSILTAIMGITKETLKHRRELKKLHEEGRLQRMLGIPPGIDPSTHLTQYHTPISLQTGDKRPPSSNDGRRESSKRRKRSPAVQAIIVDDDEVESDDDSESDEYHINEPHHHNHEVEDEKEEEEDGQIIETFPYGRVGIQRHRYESVSHDEDDFDDDFHVDSRYGLAKKSTKENRAKRQGTDDQSYLDSSDDSIVLLEPATRQNKRRASDHSNKVDTTASRAGAKMRRAFWAAKAQMAEIVSSGEE